MSNLLGLITLNLFSFADSFKKEVEKNKEKLICLKKQKNQLDVNTIFKSLDVPKGAVSVNAVNFYSWIN